MHKAYKLMDRPRDNVFRYVTHPCNFFSEHPSVIQQDEKIKSKVNNPTLLLDIEVEKTKLPKTQY